MSILIHLTGTLKGTFRRCDRAGCCVGAAFPVAKDLHKLAILRWSPTGSPSPKYLFLLALPTRFELVLQP
jgi:hypothetical protein